MPARTIRGVGAAPPPPPTPPPPPPPPRPPRPPPQGRRRPPPLPAHPAGEGQQRVAALLQRPVQRAQPVRAGRDPRPQLLHDEVIQQQAVGVARPGQGQHVVPQPLT